MNTHFLLTAFRFGSDILGKIPKREDSWPDIIAKSLAIADSAQRTWGMKSHRDPGLFSRYKFQERTSEAFVNLFFGTKLKEKFQIQRYPVNDYFEYVLATCPGGALAFQEHKWGAKTIDNDFFISRGFDLSSIIGDLWDLYPTGVFLSTQPKSRGTGTEATFSSVPPIGSTLLTTKGAERLAQMKTSRQESAPDPVTYIAVGPPGTGKTSLVQRLSMAFGGRLLKIDSVVLPSLGISELGFILDTLQPNFLLLDDLDRAPMEEARARVLFLLERLRTYPNMTVIITVNDITKLDPALLRSERIDIPVDFGLPDDLERTEIINSILGPGKVSILLEVTRGFNHIDLTDLCRRAIKSPLDQVLKAKLRLRALAEEAAPKPPKDVKGGVGTPARKSGVPAGLENCVNPE